MSDIIKTHKCPVCHKICADDKYKPFCSKRCADIDLGRWFNGSYSVPSEEVDDYEEIAQCEVLDDEENSF